MRLIVMVVIISVCGFGAGYCFHSTRFVKQDPQVMAESGELKSSINLAILSTTLR